MLQGATNMAMNILIKVNKTFSVQLYVLLLSNHNGSNHTFVAYNCIVHTGNTYNITDVNTICIWTNQMLLTALAFILTTCVSYMHYIIKCFDLPLISITEIDEL